MICTVFAVLLALVVVPAHAEEFMGVEIEGAAVNYVVLRDVNVRAAPKTESKRIMGLKKGTVVYSPGRYKGWVAVIQDGTSLGFAYKKYLMPMIDGGLASPVNGTAPIAGGGKCIFTINFIAKSEASNVMFKMADYETALNCQYGDKNVQTTMFMFLTEGPMTGSKPSLHQIGMDLLEIESDDGYDQIFSTNVLYDHNKRKITFNGVTLKDYGGNPAKTEQEVDSITAALVGAVQMALESWNENAWKELTATAE
jgi:hypothetical protein